jgi:hypothetical protein
MRAAVVIPADRRNTASACFVLRPMAREEAVMRKVLIGNALGLVMALSVPAAAERKGDADNGSVKINETMAPEATDFTCNTGGPAGLAIALASLGLIARKRRA